jgi:class 3 adenylate cyclase/CHASE2 domain-containing sensor protein
MNRVIRKAGIPLLLAACAIALSAVFYRAPMASLTFGNRLADLRVHADALANPDFFGFRNAPSFEEPNDGLALIQIDEETLAPGAGLPPFPFPRSIYGVLLKRLAAAGARSVAFDIDFLEPRPTDAAFAAGGRLLPTTIGYTVGTTAGGIAQTEVPPAELRAAMHIGYTAAGFPGGVLIDYPLQIRPVAGVPDGVASSLALSAVEASGRHINLVRVPTLNGAPLVVPFVPASTLNQQQRVGAEDFTARFAGATISFKDAMTEPIADLRAFAKDRIVLIGATAQAEGDFASSFYGSVPGMYFHARLIDQLLRGMYITPAPDALNAALLILLPLLLMALVMRLRPIVATPLAAIAIAAYVELAIALFVYRLYWLDVLHVAAAMLLTALGVIAYRAIGEAAQKRAVTAAFGLHVSTGVVAELLKHEGGASDALAGKRAKVTIFYSDIRGFTAMSEKLTPEAVYEQLNEYFEAMCEVIFNYGGYVDKFIGDCIMAVFSAPNPTPDDARKAVEAALDQQAIIEVLAQRWREAGKPPLSVGMGINTGFVVMGNLGSQKRMNYTVIGDDVNIAARLYNVAKGGQIIISESTYEEVKDFFDFNELDPVSVKGKSRPLRTFEVLGRKGEAQIPIAATQSSPA